MWASLVRKLATFSVVITSLSADHGQSGRMSSQMASDPFQLRPKVRVPVGHICTHAEQRTHCGSSIRIPLFAKFMISIPW